MEFEVPHDLLRKDLVANRGVETVPLFFTEMFKRAGHQASYERERDVTPSQECWPLMKALKKRIYSRLFRGRIKSRS